MDITWREIFENYIIFIQFSPTTDQKKNEPAHEIMVVITEATSKGLGEPAHLHSFARAFAVRTHEVWK